MPEPIRLSAISPADRRIAKLTSIKYLLPDQVKKLFSKIRAPRDRAIFIIAYYRGLRASEVGLIHMEDFRPDVNRLTVYRLKGRHGLDPWQCMISPEENHVLRAWIKLRGNAPGPIFPSRWSKVKAGKGIGRARLHMLMAKYAEIAGLPKDLRHFHILRHSIATHLLEQGKPIEIVRDWLGHRNIQSTLRYAKVTNVMRDRAAQDFYQHWSVTGAADPAPAPTPPPRVPLPHISPITPSARDAMADRVGRKFRDIVR